MYQSSDPASGPMVLADTCDADRAAYRLRIATPATAADWRAAAVVLSVRVFVPDQWQAQVRDWLDREHYQAMLGVPGCQWYRGYESTEGPFNFLNLWGLDTPEVIDSPAWADARDTPWRARLLPAFADTRRAVYTRVASSSGP
jgi:hypothetical protein